MSSIITSITSTSQQKFSSLSHHLSSSPPSASFPLLSGKGKQARGCGRAMVNTGLCALIPDHLELRSLPLSTPLGGPIRAGPLWTTGPIHSGSPRALATALRRLPLKLNLASWNNRLKALEPFNRLWITALTELIHSHIPGVTFPLRTSGLLKPPPSGG